MNKLYNMGWVFKDMVMIYGFIKDYDKLLSNTTRNVYKYENVFVVQNVTYYDVN